MCTIRVGPEGEPEGEIQEPGYESGGDEDVEFAEPVGEESGSEAPEETALTILASEHAQKKRRRFW